MILNFMKSKYHSEKTKELIRQKTLEQFKTKGHPRKGAILSEETKEKIRESVKKNWSGGSKKGIKKPKLSIVRKKLFSEGKIKKLIGNLNPSKRPEVREKISKSLINGNYLVWNKGLTTKDDNRICFGEKHGNWKGGISKLPYCDKWTNILREEIREKYNYKCYICKKDEKNNIAKSGKQRKLSVHHIDMDKEQGCNGKGWKLIPLCMICHNKLHNKTINIILRGVP